MSVNEAEVIDVLVRVRGRSADEVAEKLDWLIAGGLDILEVTEPMAREAGRIRAAHYHREHRPLSQADCVALAAALLTGDELATSDPPLAAVATALGVRVIGLPDSRGQMP